MGTDPRQIVEQETMSTRQWLAVFITIFLNALDGFDVLSSAFAGPGIKQEWGLGPDGLGVVLSMELIGMGVGSVLLGGLADKLGRRPTILGCLMLMASGMFLATTATTPQALSIWRVLTGLGIGGMLAATNAVVFELSNLKSRAFALSLMVIGYPLGAFLGGQVAAWLLQDHGWRSIFMFGGLMTAVCFPLVLLFVPETPAWINQARPAGALERINRILTEFGHSQVEALAPLAAAEAKASLGDIFRPQYIRATILLSLGYSAHALTFYYILKMAPAIISDPQFAGQSFTKAQGAAVLSYANLGGAIGGAVFGWFMHRFGVKAATLGALALSVVAVIHFGLGQTTIPGWTMAVILTGLTTNAGVVGYYAGFGSAFPTHIKATGTGFALTVARGGAALSPIMAGLLFKGQFGLFYVSLIMAMGSALSFFLFLMLPMAKEVGHKTD